MLYVKGLSGVWAVEQKLHCFCYGMFCAAATPFTVQAMH